MRFCYHIVEFPKEMPTIETLFAGYEDRLRLLKIQCPISFQMQTYKFWCKLAVGTSPRSAHMQQGYQRSQSNAPKKPLQWQLSGKCYYLYTNVIWGQMYMHRDELLHRYNGCNLCNDTYKISERLKQLRFSHIIKYISIILIGIYIVNVVIKHLYCRTARQVLVYMYVYL